MDQLIQSKLAFQVAQLVLERAGLEAERDHLLAALNQAQAERDQLLAELDQAQAERDQLLAELDQATAPAQTEGEGYDNISQEEFVQ